MREHGLRAKKRLGQNFLLDEKIAGRIAALAVDEPGRRVVEIGGGTGALTRTLLQLEAKVLVVEIDPELVAVMRAQDDLAAAEIVEGDALQFDFDAVAAAGPWHMAGNLPYNAGTPLVADLAMREDPPLRMVVMLQKDVVDRLVAAPSTPAYGALTLLTGARMTARRAFTIGPSHFHPRPTVESSVVVLERRPEPVKTVFPRFYDLVRGAFAYRRKTLANSLLQAMGIPREQTTSALADLDLNPESRAEQLDLAAFAELAVRMAG